MQFNYNRDDRGIELPRHLGKNGCGVAAAFQVNARGNPGFRIGSGSYFWRESHFRTLTFTSMCNTGLAPRNATI
jgi:hypothetical protein